MPQLEKDLEAWPQAAEPAKAAPPPSGPCVMVIFGATGDLTARKLIPALYNLARSNLLSREFAIVGVGRSTYNLEQFRQAMGDKLQKFATGEQYTLPATLDDCECGDATWRSERPGGCKHQQALRQALVAVAAEKAKPHQRPPHRVERDEQTQPPAA